MADLLHLVEGVEAAGEVDLRYTVLAEEEEEEVVGGQTLPDHREAEAEEVEVGGQPLPNQREAVVREEEVVVQWWRQGQHPPRWTGRLQRRRRQEPPHTPPP